MKSTAGFIVTLIGGIGQLLAALMLFAGGAFLSFMIPGFLSALGVVMPIIYLVAGGVSIWASLKMKKDDNAEVKKGGIIALISGIVGFNIIVIIGGIIAMVQANK
tara:strand:- start:1160 stop:1474 length:315 start_codon:yes stop_codon:yes gene_type:complete